MKTLLALLAFATFLPTLNAADMGIYIAAGHGGHRMSSNDGLTWTNHEFWGPPAHNQQDLKAIATGNGTCVVVGGYSKSNILTTKDGIEWHQNEFNMGVLSGVLFREGRFLAFGEGAKVAESKDGMTWKVIGDGKAGEYGQREGERLGTEKVKVNIRKWREANGIYVGAGDNSIITSTKDFKKWEFAERVEPVSRLMLESDGKTFVAAGQKTLDWSTDGVQWTRLDIALGEKGRFNNLVHDGERFIVTAGREGAWESNDGKTWKAVKNATLPGTIATLRPDLYYSFETYYKFTEKMMVSTDKGKTWKETTLPAPTGVTCIVFVPDIAKF